jgi:hypothetical protein
MPDETHTPADGKASAPAADIALLMESLKRGPRGALTICAIAVTLLFLGWLAFYFLVYIPRGAIG